MKKFFCLLMALAWSAVAFAQTAEEILTRMSEVWDAHEKEGLAMTIETKIPILGKMILKEYTLGNKSRTESKTLGITAIAWDDGVTQWTYTDKNNKVEIKDSETGTSSESSDSELFSDISDDGYDLSIKKETADSWLLLCKKSKTNTDKDMPKTVEITVAKKTFYPISLKTKMGSISILMRDISFGVKEDFVTFRMADYPDAKVEDLRGVEKDKKKK